MSSSSPHSGRGLVVGLFGVQGRRRRAREALRRGAGPARGIRVNAVAPGVTDTEMSNFAKTEAGHSFILGMQALQRIAEPADIGSVVAFLASDDARWITGTTIHVDGGSKL